MVDTPFGEPIISKPFSAQTGDAVLNELLIEDGSKILLESGGKLLLE